MNPIKEQPTTCINDIRERLARVAEPPWIHEMHDYYRNNGHFRHQDLHRLLGDQNRAVEIGPNESVSKYFSGVSR